MSCNEKKTDLWNTVITITGGIAAGTAAVAVVVAAPVELAAAAGALVLTKMAVDYNNKQSKCDDPDHTHD